MPESTESSMNLKKSTLAQVVEKELGSSTAAENKKPPVSSSFEWSFGKKKDATNGKNATTSTPKIEPSVGGFVFGSRLSEKVTNADSSSADDRPKDASSIFKQFSTKKPGDSFFSFKKSQTDEDGSTFKPFGDPSAQPKTFNTAASNSEAEQVENITGEEAERNLSNISCKFYAFDREERAWKERGLGSLRINEKIGAENEYRLVGRATGNQRVCINSKVFPEMLLERVTEKRLKLSAMSGDSDAPQLFIVNATPAAIVSLQQTLERLIDRVKQNANRKRPRESDGTSDIPAKSSQKSSKKIDTTNKDDETPNAEEEAAQEQDR